MKIAFFLDNRSISSVDCSCILEGNPGIGGTECMIVTISSLLAMRTNGIEMMLLTMTDGIFPKYLNHTVVNDFREAIEYAEKNEYEYLVFKHDVEHIYDKSLEFDLKNLKLIVWCHVFVCYWELDYYANNSAINHIVYVSREMADLYRDHKSYKKSSYIYNCVNTDGIRKTVLAHPICQRKNIVTYIGNIVPFKGFHLLAEAWPSVIKAIPDAELYVIGNGRLYDDKKQLGKYGIAEESYENFFIKYLCKDGQLLPNVHFLGMLGKEKKDVLLQTKVGVPNPSGITETFGISAVEMQMFGAKVTTIKCPGYIETVINGALYNNRKDLAECIIMLLKSNNTSHYDKAMDFFETTFSFEAVLKRWELILLSGKMPKDKRLYNPWYRCKFLKEWMRQVKEFCPIAYKLPPLERILLLIERITHGKGQRYIDSDIKI